MAQPPTQPRFSTPSPPLPPQMHAGWPGSASIRQVPVFFVPNTVMPYPIYQGNLPPAGAPMFLGTPAGPHSSARTYAVSLTPRGSPSVSSLPLAATSPSVTAIDVEKLKPVPVPVVVPEPESTKTEDVVFRQVVDCLMKSGPCTMSALYHSVPKSAQQAIMECGSVKAFLATSPHFVVDDDSKSVSLAETEETLALLSSMTAAASNSSVHQRTTSMDAPVSASLTKHHSAPEAAPSAALESKLPVSSIPVEPKTFAESTVVPTSAPTKRSSAVSVVSSTAVSTVTSSASRVVITNPVSGEPVVLTRATKSVIITDAAGRPVELPNKVKTKMPKAPATAPNMPVSFAPSWPRAKADGGADGSKQVDIGDHVAKPLSAGVSNSAKFPWAAKNNPQRAVVPLHETTTEHAKLMSIFMQPSTPPTPLSEEQKSATISDSSVIKENIFVDRSLAASAGTAAATAKSSELEPFAADEANSGPLKYGMVDAVECGTSAIGDEDVDAVSVASSSTLVGHTQQANTSNSRLRLEAPVFQSRSSFVLKTDSNTSAINPCASEFVPLAASSAASKTSSGVSIVSSSLVDTTYSRLPQKFVINCADDGDDSSSYDSHPDTPRRKELTRKRGSASTAKSKDVRAGGDVHCSMSATACVQCCDACVTMETQNALCDQCSLGLHARASGKRVSETEHRELEVKAAMLLMLLTTSDANEKQKLLDESSSALTTCQQQAMVASVTSALPQIPVSLEPYDSLVKDTRRLLSVCRKSSVLVNAGKMASDSRSSSTIATVDDDFTATPRCKNRPHYMRPPKPVDQELSTDDDCESLPPSRVSHDKNKPAASRVDSRGDDVRPSSVTLQGIVMDVEADVKSEPSGLLSSQAAMMMMSMPAPAPTPTPSTPDITVQKLLQTMVFAQQQQQQQMLQVQKQQQILAAIQALGGSSAVMNDPSLFAIVQKMAADPLPTTAATFPSVSNPLMPSTFRPLASSTSNPLAAVLTANPLLQSAVGSSALANSMANPLAAFSGNSYLQSQISGMDPLQAQNLLGMSNALGASLSNFATLQNLLGTLPQQFGGGIQNSPGISSQAFGVGGVPDVLPSSQAAGVGLQSQVGGVPYAATAHVASTGIQQSPSPQSVSLGMSMSLSTVSQALGAGLSNMLSAQTSTSQARDSSVASSHEPAQALPSVADIKIPLVPQTSIGITPSPAAPLLDEGSKNKLSSSLSSYGDVDDLLSTLHQQTAIRDMTHLMNDLKVDIEGSPSLSSTQLSKPVRSTSADTIAKSNLLLSISRVSVAHSDIRGNRDEDRELNSSDDERRTARIMNDGFLTSLSETLTSVKDGTVDKMLPADLRRVTTVKENDDDELEEDFVLTKRDSLARGRRNNEDHWEAEDDFWSVPTDKWMLKETMQKTLNNLTAVETTRGSMCSGTIAADNKVKAGDGLAQSQSRIIATGSHETNSCVEDRRPARTPVSSEISRSVVSTAQSQSYSGAKRRFDNAGSSNASQLNSGSSVSMAATGGQPSPGEQQMATGSWTLRAHIPENFKFGNLQPPGKSSIRRWDSEETEEPELPQRRPLVNWENVLTSPTKTTTTNSSASGASAALPDNNKGEFGRLNAPPTSFLANGRDAGNSCREDASDGGRSEAKPEVKVTKEKSKFARLTDSLQAKHPNKTEKDIHDAMKTVRASRGGTLANVPMSVVLQEASELLSASTTRAEPTPVAVTTDHQAVCCICADVMLPTHSVDRLDCDHSFHASCIRRWLEQNRTCPVCRNMALLQDEFPSLSAAQSRFK